MTHGFKARVYLEFLSSHFVLMAIISFEQICGLL